MSLRQLSNLSLLADVNLLSDFFFVVLNGSLPERNKHHWVSIEKLDPVWLPDGKGSDLTQWLVEDLWSLVKHNGIDTNHAHVCLNNANLLLLVDLKSNSNFALVGKDELLCLVQLIKNDGSSGFLPWLDVFKNVNHKFFKFSVFPGVETVYLSYFPYHKEISKFKDKSFVEVLEQQVVLDILW